jgi:ketosteroid isomerase-like protein
VALSIEDRLAVEDLMVRYAYGIDVDCTEAQWLSLFTEDAVMISPLSGHHEGVEGMKKFRERFIPRRGKTQIRHIITNVMVDGEGDTATYKAYFFEFKTEISASAPKTEFLFAGSYDCTMVKRGKDWKIKRRRVYIDDRPEPRS